MITFKWNDEDKKEEFLDEIRMVFASHGIEAEWKDIETYKRNKDAVVTLVFKNVVE
ncbi:hypothetical protein [Paenibacillus xylanilyticus]|uniref:Uncharacterized protein n=1 Tax=Paenibacillus xylanilyticus TaxID=248903 RepID=A0A7Y6BXU0_9BACL|nr:hypothetical protein [Paenibacillus xylanilyticus]NUU76934.1 hypothetical protein [Paenibacillus xylanilyticus]